MKIRAFPKKKKGKKTNQYLENKIKKWNSGNVQRGRRSKNCWGWRGLFVGLFFCLLIYQIMTKPSTKLDRWNTLMKFSFFYLLYWTIKIYLTSDYPTWCFLASLFRHFFGLLLELLEIVLLFTQHFIHDIANLRTSTKKDWL